MEPRQVHPGHANELGVSSGQRLRNRLSLGLEAVPDFIFGRARTLETRGVVGPRSTVDVTLRPDEGEHWIGLPRGGSAWPRSRSQDFPLDGERQFEIFRGRPLPPLPEYEVPARWPLSERVVRDLGTWWRVIEWDDMARLAYRPPS
jgi:hypothetical protein